MKTEEELKDFLYKCEKVISFGMSSGPCPFEEHGGHGCCAECSTPSTIRWVLNKEINPTDTGQKRLVKAFGSFVEEEPQAFKTEEEKEEISKMAFKTVYSDKLDKKGK